ncbi:hypothetical protein LPJ66_001430 [Kickxella alabastrina]|uniref:Uncharacterized protein n=1 Tax=Kickxella alabastrina TaxID=61397 RepID=A0ACC1ITA2_9FUNG|nr:hypothetical protein LPJ66_001430 [Kickxella alabastrina]
MRGVPNKSEESLSLSDILCDDNGSLLQHALMTGFIVDEGWLLGHFSSQTSLTLISNKTINARPADQRIIRVFPELPRPQVQIIHTKIMLLFFPGFVRFVVSSANLAEDDWSVLQNIVFVQDFMRDPSLVFPANDFSMSLAYALHDLSVPFEIIGWMNNVDFSTATAQIVTSVPTGGQRMNMNMAEYGMERLAVVIKNIKKLNTTLLDYEFTPDARMYCVGSSLGPLDHRWLRDIYLCAHGINPRNHRDTLWKNTVPDNLIDIAVAFHTQKQVDRCRYDIDCSQYIYARPETFNAREFPQSHMFCVQPHFSRTIVHAKVILTRVGEDQTCGWMYLGSHNFTPGAWGRLRVKSGEDIYVNNYEFGLVLNNMGFVDQLDQNGNKDGRASVSWRGEPLVLPFKYMWQPFERDDVPYFTTNQCE